MAEIVVAAESRTETGKNVNRRLRVRGLIPGVLYGAKKEAIPLSVSPKEIATILRSVSGSNTLFDLELGGTRRKVILKEFQLEPLKGKLLHADFYEVALDKLLQVRVHVELQGTPVGVRVEGGVIDFVTRELEVECLPTEIPERIIVDVTDLALGKHKRVSELSVPPRVKVLTDADLVVVHVVAPRAEEVVAAPEVAVEGEAVAEPEVIKKGKAEEGAEEKPEKERIVEKPEKPEKDKKEKK